MNSISVTALLLLGLLLASFMVLLAITIVFNTRAGMKYRATLAIQLEQLRLGKMLTALGIDTDNYLSRERAVDIRQHMERCTACTNTQECDTRLQEDKVDIAAIDFCNNEASLQQFSKKTRGHP